VVEASAVAGLVDAACDKDVFPGEVEFQANRPLLVGAVTTLPVGSAVPVVVTSVLVLSNVSTTALTTVCELRMAVVRVVIVAIGTTHSIVPVCWRMRSSISAEPPSIDNLEQP
jgi:hypothetical protein